MKKTLNDIEVDCLLEAIKEHYGYDFRNYARASLKRRIKNFLVLSDFEHISELIPKVLHDKNVFAEFLHNMSVTVTEMFRDPSMFKYLRENVIPKLKISAEISINPKTYPGDFLQKALSLKWTFLCLAKLCSGPQPVRKKVAGQPQ